MRRHSALAGAFLAAALAFGAPAEAQTEIWSATLTVAPDSNTGGSARGYCHPDAGADRCTTAYGELSDNDFTLGSTTYVVESLRWGTAGSTNLHLTLDRDFPTADLDNLTLQVGSDTFALDDATRNNDDVDVDNNYRWTSTQAIRDLAADAEVTVKLLHVSGDATLSGLSLSDVTLDPVFASGTEAYTASAAYSVAQVTVTPTVNKSTATVEYLGTGDAAIDDADTATAGHQADLSVGANTIKVRVTAPDTTTQKTYTVTVTRTAAATDATLKSLVLSEGELNPGFAAATTAYTAAVASSVAPRHADAGTDRRPGDAGIPGRQQRGARRRRWGRHGFSGEARARGQHDQAQGDRGGRHHEHDLCTDDNPGGGSHDGPGRRAGRQCRQGHGRFSQRRRQ